MVGEAPHLPKGLRTPICGCLVGQSFPPLDCAEKHLPCPQESRQPACPLTHSLLKDIPVVGKTLRSTEQVPGGLRNRDVVYIYKLNGKAQIIPPLLAELKEGLLLLLSGWEK